VAAPRRTTVLSRIQQSSAQAELPREYVLSVANDYPHKDWDRLIERSGRRRRAAARAGGEAPVRPQVRRVGRIDRVRGARRVIVWGPETDRARLASLYRERGLPWPTLSSRRSLTPFEAFSWGLPLAASDIPAIARYARSAPTTTTRATRGLIDAGAPRILAMAGNVARRKR